MMHACIWKEFLQTSSIQICVYSLSDKHIFIDIPSIPRESFAEFLAGRNYLKEIVFFARAYWFPHFSICWKIETLKHTQTHIFICELIETNNVSGVDSILANRLFESPEDTAIYIIGFCCTAHWKGHEHTRLIYYTHTHTHTHTQRQPAFVLCLFCLRHTAVM